MNMFSNIFGGGATGTPKQEPAPAPTPPATPPAQVTPGNIPPEPGAEVTKPEDTNPDTASPLDQYAKLWDTKDNNADTQGPFAVQSLDPAELAKTVGAADFSKSFSPETLASIAAGGEQAQTAFLGAMNTAIQTAISQSTMINNKLLQSNLGAYDKHAATQVAGQFNSLQSASQLQADNPAYGHKAVAPVVGLLKEQVQQQNPNATAEEINEVVNGYMQSMVGAFKGKPEDTPQSKEQGGDFDFSEYLK